jgi:hypothetical protein
MALEGVRHAERLNEPISLVLGLRRACVQQMLQRNVQGVLELSRQLLAVNAGHETFVGAREGSIFNGWALFHVKKEATRLEEVRTCLEQLDNAKHWVMLPYLMASVAQVLGEQGDASGAMLLLDRAAELITLTSEKWCEPEIIRLNALFGRHSTHAAAELLHVSLGKAREQSAKLWELRSATSLAELCYREGKCGDAVHILAPVYKWFADGNEDPDVIAARGLLHRVARERV